MAVATPSGTVSIYAGRLRLVSRGRSGACGHRQHAEPLVTPLILLAPRSCGLEIKVARARLKILGNGPSLLRWPNRKPPHHAFGGVALRMRPRLSRPLRESLL
jgi:hypothetical protein